MASTEFISVRKFLRTQIFCRIFLLSSRSSLLVLDAGISIDGKSSCWRVSVELKLHVTCS
jgi:hypothetical protein